MSEDLGVHWLMVSTDEEEIVWLEDPASMPYVREMIDIFASSRRRPLVYTGNGRCVGYSVLRADAPNNGMRSQFTRRIFWLAPWDPYEGRQPPAGVPCEAVDPFTVRPGQMSRKTMRMFSDPHPASGSPPSPPPPPPPSPRLSPSG